MPLLERGNGAGSTRPQRADGKKRVATERGIAFVAQRTYPDERNVWHGYPEAWDQISVDVKNCWLSEGRITKRDLRRWKTREAVQAAWSKDWKC